MVKTLLTWPPNTPPSKYNVLRRQRYCGALGPCAHTDIRCCCNIPVPGCGCSNWPDDDCVPTFLPDLTFELEAPTCPAMEFTCNMPRCASGFTPPAAQGYWHLSFGDPPCNLTNCLSNGSASLYCERNLTYQNPGCFDYKLDFGATVSGCVTSPPDPEWPTSCSCGNFDASEEAFWRWDGVYALETVGASCDQICNCPGATVPIPINIYIHGMPPDPATLTTLSSSLPRPISSPHRGIEVDDDLPEDVSNWLNNN